MPQKLMHCTAVANDKGAVLLRGDPGSGKSDLALRLIEQDWKLIADDQTLLWIDDEGPNPVLYARCPDTIRGQLEVRGVGIVRAPALAEARVALIVDLVPAEAVQRLPEQASEVILGVRLPVVRFNAFEGTTPIKLRMALEDAHYGVPPDAGEAPAPTGPALAGEGTVLVTGMSGAGRSTALKLLEDMGYESIDNCPLDLVATIVPMGEPARAIALGIDIRTRRFAVEPFLNELDRLEEVGVPTRLLFLDCDDEVLVRRYTETRRRHPLAEGRPVSDGIAAERRLVQPLRDRADVVIDTTMLTPAELRRLLNGYFGSKGTAAMMVFVTSFSYRTGLPREADLVFDTRFLANPHYDEKLKPLTGSYAEVSAYIQRDPSFAPFFERMTAMLEFLMPLYEREGKSYLTIAIGCTGGRHRSVMVAERLADWLKDRNIEVHLSHRDVERETLVQASRR